MEMARSVLLMELLIKFLLTREISFIKDKIIAINSTIKDLELDQNKLKQIFPSTNFFKQ